MSYQQVRVYEVGVREDEESKVILHDRDEAMAIIDIRKRFQSNNDLPVEHSTLKSYTREEWVSEYVPSTLPRYINTRKEVTQYATDV